jgi:hypothetical protein
MILSIDLPCKDNGRPLNVTFEGDEADAAILRAHGYTVIERRQVNLPGGEVLRAIGAQG